MNQAEKAPVPLVSLWLSPPCRPLGAAPERTDTLTAATVLLH